MKRIEQRLRTELEEIESNGLMRKLKAPSGIDLSSNDYLGLAMDSRLREAAQAEIKTGTIGSTGSRLLRGERNVFEEAENAFARWKGTEAALYFATGYQANIGLMQTFLREGDTVFSDALNHASLIDGIRLGKARKFVYPHCDVGELERMLAEANSTGEKFVVTESLFSMDGDIAPLTDIAELCRVNGANLIIDEAHAVGIFGETGSGLIEEHGIEEDVFLSVNTAGKALGVSGAFAAGNQIVIDYLINKCRSFIFSTAPMPAAAAAILTSIGIIKSDKALRLGLREICKRFEELLFENGIRAGAGLNQIVPIMIGESIRAVQIAEALQAQGFDVRAIRPPTVAEGTARLRISLNTMIGQDLLTDFVKCLKAALGK
jgi:8-amino-7-oxononanoate synthase